MKSEVHLIDCMEFMRSVPDKAYSLAVVDPPYGIGETAKKALSRARSTNKWKNAKPKIYSGNNEWDNNIPQYEYFIELFRVSKNQIIWGANYFPQYLTGSMGWISWYKKGQNPNSDFSDCELAFTSFNRALKFFNYSWVGFGAVNAKEHRIHPTQKPVALYDWIFRNYAKPGDTILDTHMGSQSSRISAYKAGLDFTGCELDPEYFRDGNERFRNFLLKSGTTHPDKAMPGQQINLF